MSSNITKCHQMVPCYMDFVFDYHKFMTFGDIFSDLVNHQK